MYVYVAKYMILPQWPTLSTERRPERNVDATYQWPDRGARPYQALEGVHKQPRAGKQK